MLQVVWFKRDLRVRDHQPLYLASKHEKVLPIYIIEPSIWSYNDLSKRHYTFIEESLVDLQQSLRSIGSDLFVAIDEIENVLDAIYQTYGSFQLLSHMEHGISQTYDRDKRVKNWMHQHHCIWIEKPSFAVVRYKKDPKRRDFLDALLDEPIYPVPKFLALPTQILPLLTNDLKKLRQFEVKGSDIKQGTKGGEQEAIKHAQAFFGHRYKKYNVYINKPYYSTLSSSLLAPYITWGNVSIKSLHVATKRHLEKLALSSEQGTNDFDYKQLKAFQQRLYWHCSFVQMVERNPMMHIDSLDQRYENARITDYNLLAAFAKGETGLTFVDACMKALIDTGWINFKQRAMLASFACNTLLLDWRDVGYILGQLWLDYDPAIHWSQMQVQAGHHVDAHIPMYDVIKQGRMHDAEGLFIKKYLPKLAKVDANDIHEPWLLEPNPYKQPIIDYRNTFEKNKKLLYDIKKVPLL